MITGHRPQKLGGFKPNPTQTWVRAKLRKTLAEAKKQHPEIEVISGMALGVDQWWAEEALVRNPISCIYSFSRTRRALAKRKPAAF